MEYTVELDSAEAGGKARSLARLRAAGLRTPAGFAVGGALFRALHTRPLPAQLDAGALEKLDAARAALARAPWPEGFLVELNARLQGERFSVRSSFAGEDDATALAAGVYLSRVNVSRAEVPAAVREVLLSAISPAAVAYAAAEGRAPAAPPVAVLIHEYVPNQAGSAALDPAGGQPIVTPPNAEVEAALRALAAREGAIEVEWTAPPLTFLQMRPYRPSPPARPWAGFAGVDPLAWRWDAAHNPLPLTPAQAGLVELADERCRIGIRQRVLGGYLFWTPGGTAPPERIAPAEARTALESLRQRVEMHLAEQEHEPDLERALDLFLSAYERIFGVIQPAARAGRQALADYLRTIPDAPALSALLAGVPSLAAERRHRASALARSEPSRAIAEAGYLALFGDESPAWDVAVPTYRERPDALHVTRPIPEIAPPLITLPPDGAALLAIARDCVAAGEDDDWLYARLQAAVRRALLAIGERLAASGALPAPDDIFFVPLSVLRQAAPGDLAAHARAGRAAYAEALHEPPPAAPDAVVLRGSGTSGRVLGRVHRHRPGSPVPPDAILVAETLLPTELPLLTAAALVTESGGPLDHVATQARERGLPALVGVAGARNLRDGERVLVDADQGMLVRMPGNFSG